MDLIEQLAGTLGIDAKAAQAVAGVVLGAARDQVPDEETAKLDEAVPEIGDWSSVADQVLDSASEEASGGLFGAIARFAGSGVGNDLVGAVLGEDAQDTAQIVALFKSIGLKTEHASLAAPIVLNFLVERVGQEWTDRILQGAPMLMQFAKSQLTDDGHVQTDG